MDSTLIVCEKRADLKVLLDLIKKVLGPSTSTEPGSFSGSFGDYSAVAVVFTLEHGGMTKETSVFLDHFARQLHNARIALLCSSDDSNAALIALHEAERRLGRRTVFTGAVEKSALLQHSAEVALQLTKLKRKLKDLSEMPENLLIEQINQVLLSHNTCTLCTGFGTAVRATPIEYMVHQGCVCFICEGGEKFANLSVNPRVSIAVYNSYSGFDKLEGLQIEGTVEMLEAFSDEYLLAMKSKGLTESRLRALPATLNMFKVLPSRYELLKSDLVKNGYRAKQVLNIT